MLRLHIPVRNDIAPCNGSGLGLRVRVTVRVGVWLRVGARVGARVRV